MFCGNGSMNLESRGCDNKYDKHHNFCKNICCLRELCQLNQAREIPQTIKEPVVFNRPKHLIMKFDGGMK